VDCESHRQEADKSLIFRVARAAFPNWEGAELKRSFAIVGDELKYTDPHAPAGGFATVIWETRQVKYAELPAREHAPDVCEMGTGSKWQKSGTPSEYRVSRRP
jgi:hypothetical protein